MGRLDQLPSDRTNSVEAPGGNEFTTLSFIGLYLTLNLCMLTQPYGSLLYQPLGHNSNRSSRFIFFLWRLNPLACVAEAILIVRCLLGAMERIRQEEGPTFSRTYPYYNGDLRIEDWKSKLHIYAAGLLLLRANGDNDGTARLLYSLLDVPFPDTRLSHQNELCCSSGPADLELLSAGHHTDDAELQADTGNQRINRPEDCPPNDDAGGGRVMELLRNALGRDVLVREEIWVDLVTAFSVLVVAIKLSVVGLPWSAKLIPTFYLIGWCSVQLLVVLAHAENLEGTDLRLIARTVYHHQTQIDQIWVTVGINVFLLLSLVYLLHSYTPHNSVVWQMFYTVEGAIGFSFIIWMLFLIFRHIAILAFASLSGIFAMYLFMSTILLYDSVPTWAIRFGEFGGTAFFALLLLVFHTLPTSDGVHAGHGIIWIIYVTLEIIALILLGLSVYSYNPVGTQKPSWLDVLG